MISAIINEQVFAVILEDNDTACAFAKLLPMSLDMNELNGNEKYHYLMSSIPSEPEHVDEIHEGDLMLFGDNCVVLFYDNFKTPYNYTRIGHLSHPTGLKNVLGSESIIVTFCLTK